MRTYDYRVVIQWECNSLNRNSAYFITLVRVQTCIFRIDKLKYTNGVQCKSGLINTKTDRTSNADLPSKE